MKAAIIGLGVIGKVHAEILSKQGVEVVAVCDVDPSRCAVIPSARAYTDYRELYRRERPDVVHVCTPHYLHADMVVDALNAGINVLCEKPLCIRKEDIPRILEAERESSAQLGVCLQNRYNESTRYALKYLESKRILNAVGSVVWHRDAAYYASGDWRGKRETEGGGVLINQALHTLDLLSLFVGMPSFVTSTVDNLTLRGQIEVEDTAFALYSGGAEFSLLATVGSSVDYPATVTVKTEDETLTVYPDRVTVGNSAVDFSGETVYVKPCYGSSHEALIADFYSCVSGGRRFSIGGEEGAKVVRLILSTYLSGGKKVPILTFS